MQTEPHIIKRFMSKIDKNANIALESCICWEHVFDFLKKEKLVKELIDWIEKSQDEKGRFKPISMFMDYKDWDFANKKEPSPWIAFLCCRILKRWYG